MILRNAFASVQSRRIYRVNRIRANISVPVYAIVIPSWVGLHEPSQRRGVDAGLIIIHSDLWEPSLTSILKTTQIGSRWNAIFVIGVDRNRAAASIGNRNHAAALIGLQPTSV